MLAQGTINSLLVARPALKANGAIAQLGERYNGIVEVSGSIPLSSTKLFNDLTQKFLGLTVILGHFYLDQSSRGMQPRGNAVREARKLLWLFLQFVKKFS